MPDSGGFQALYSLKSVKENLNHDVLNQFGSDFSDSAAIYKFFIFIII